MNRAIITILLVLFEAWLTALPFSGALAQDSCSSFLDIKESCLELRKEDRCSRELTEYCCGCEESWNISLPYCEYNSSLFPTPTPTSSPTPVPQTPTPTSIPTSPSGTPTPDPTPFTVCDNGFDDDGDGLTDFPSDPGCEVLLDDTETNSEGSACDNGKDDDGDGLVDMKDSGCSSVSDDTEFQDLNTDGCKTSKTKDEARSIILSGSKLVRLVKSSLSKLEKASRTSRNSSLRRNLSSSAKRALKQMKMHLKEGEQSLDGLPEEVVVCPDGNQCLKVDNSSRLSKFEAAMIGLRKVGVRALNRATRLTSSTTEDARKASKKLGKKVKTTSNELISRASKIPKIHSSCGG